MLSPWTSVLCRNNVYHLLRRHRKNTTSLVLLSVSSYPISQLRPVIQLRSHLKLTSFSQTHLPPPFPRPFSTLSRNSLACDGHLLLTLSCTSVETLSQSEHTRTESHSMAVLALQAMLHRSMCLWMQPQSLYVVMRARHMIECVEMCFGLGRSGELQEEQLNWLAWFGVI